MLASLIPIPDDTIYWSSPITKPVLLTEQCDAYWPLMSTVYTADYLSELRMPIRKCKHLGKLRRQRTASKSDTERLCGCFVRSKTTRTMNQPIVITIDGSATTNIYIHLIEVEKWHPQHCRSNWLRQKIQRVMYRRRV